MKSQKPTSQKHIQHEEAEFVHQINRYNKSPVIKFVYYITFIYVFSNTKTNLTVSITIAEIVHSSYCRMCTF